MSIQNSHRIEYIDALRGITMILVVFNHVELFSFLISPALIANEVFMSFRMPLFFFISGFIGYKAGVEWTRKTWWAMSKKKLMVQLIPTFFFGLIYAYAYCKADITTFITDIHKLGYWFTIVLLEMFLLLYTMNYLLHLCGKTLRFHKFLTLTILTIVFILARFNYIPSLERLFDVFSLRLFFLYFPYFAFGYICSMYRDTFNKVLDHKYFAAMVIISFAVFFCVGKAYLTTTKESSFFMYFSEVIVDLFIGIFGLFTVFNTFRVYQDSFTSEKRVGRALQYIGKRTLDIYLLHYFFIPYLPQVGRMLEQGNNATIELALGGGISLLIIGLCLVVSNVLRTSPILAKILFGVKLKS